MLKGTRFTTIDEPRAGGKIGEGTMAVGLNDAGTVVGWYLASKNAERGFVLRNGKFTSINLDARPLLTTGDRPEPLLPVRLFPMIA